MSKLRLRTAKEICHAGEPTHEVTITVKDLTTKDSAGVSLKLPACGITAEQALGAITKRLRGKL